MSFLIKWYPLITVVFLIMLVEYINQVRKSFNKDKEKREEEEIMSQKQIPELSELKPGGVVMVNEIVGISGAAVSEQFHGHPMFYKVLWELADLHSKKNSDYANEDPLSNLRMCEIGGIPAWKGVIVRLTDKISRLLTFAKREKFEVKDESVEDTFRDAAVYSILGLILYRESREEN